MKYIISNIQNDKVGYQRLIDFYEECQKIGHLELSFYYWFAANMSAAVGGMLDLLQQGGVVYSLGDISSGIENILKKNGFLRHHFNYSETVDNYHTTIPYQKLSPYSGEVFNDYVSNQLFERNEMPLMSQGVKSKMTELIYELFVNAQLHSGTEHIYTCGQFFPYKNKIEFTIVDTGVGFKEKVNRKFNSKLSAEQAIKWAVQDKNTTKDITGGIGLAMLKEFTEYNNGKIQIISSDGYYQFSKGLESTDSFEGAFPGTIINIQFKTNDNSSYILKKELDINKIF